MTTKFPPRLNELGGGIQGTMLAVKSQLVDLQVGLRKKRYPSKDDMLELTQIVTAIIHEVNRVGGALVAYDRALKEAGVNPDLLQYTE